MNFEQRGKYIYLLCAQHQHGGYIEKNSFNAIVGNDEMLKSKFEESEQGFFNKRLVMEILKRKKDADSSRENGKKGGRPAKPNQNPQVSNSKPNQNLIENENINEIENEITNESEIVIPFDAPEFLKIWETLLIQPKWKRKTIHALQLALKKLSKYPVEIAIQMIENSIEGNYQGIFPINQNSKQSTQQDRDHQFISQSKFAK